MTAPWTNLTLVLPRTFSYVLLAYNFHKQKYAKTREMTCYKLTRITKDGRVPHHFSTRENTRGTGARLPGAKMECTPAMQSPRSHRIPTHFRAILFKKFHDGIILHKTRIPVPSREAVLRGKCWATVRGYLAACRGNFHSSDASGCLQDAENYSVWGIETPENWGFDVHGTRYRSFTAIPDETVAPLL